MVRGQSEHIEVPFVGLRLFGLSIQVRSFNGLVKNWSISGYGGTVPVPVENVPWTL
jgi:hypothetical protein